MTKAMLALIPLVLSAPLAPALAAWEEIGPVLPVAPTRIGFDLGHPDRIFLGTWGDGLHVSGSAGASWSRNYTDFYVSDGVASTVVIEAQVTGSRGVAATLSGVYVSDSGGANWLRDPANDTGDAPGIGFRVARIPDGTGMVVSEIGDLTVGGTFWIHRFDDGSWTPGSTLLQGFAGGDTKGIGFGIEDPPVLYVGNTVRNFWTDDLGATLHNNSLGLPDDDTQVVVADPEIPGRALAAVAGGLYRATSPGGGWSAWGTGITGTILDLVHDPTDPDRVFLGSTSGVFESEDRGATWTAMTTEGLPYTHVLDVAIHPLAPGRLLVSASDGSPGAGGLFATDIGTALTVDAATTTPIAIAAWPNPMGATTTLRLSLAPDARASVELFDVSGRRVRSLPAPTGHPHRSIHWDGRDHRGAITAPGVYVARIVVDGVRRGSIKLLRVE